jgi:hypothetical protein
MATILIPASQREQQIAITPTEEKLLLDAYVQPYPRVSTPEQRKNMSAEMQQDKKFALLCGWPEELIIMDTRDLGVSGRLRMEDRLTFSEMITRIAEGIVKTIIAANVSRLFRDRWGKEYARFMEICFTYGVKVVIANKTRTGIEHIYDFSKSSDVDLFRRKCEEAWSYIENQIGMMHALKDEVGYSGRWAGWSLPTGFMVDLREYINREENPNYKKYIPYAAWAEQVARLQERYREMCGNINELYRELERTGFLFPPLDESFPKELVGKIHLKPVYANPDAPEEQRVITGYKIASVSGLAGILSNPANIGHFVYKGVIRYNNHPAIVNYMDFIYAFNRLSSSNLDGTPNTEYLERASRYVKRHASEKPAYLRNHIRPADEKTYTVFTEDVATKTEGRVPFYEFYLRGGGVRHTVYRIAAPDVDGLFLARFVERIQSPVAENEFTDFLSQEQTEYKAHQKRLKELQVHIAATQSLMAKLKRRLILLKEEDANDNEIEAEDEKDTPKEDLVKEINRAYKGHKLELQRLQAQYEQLSATGTETEKRRSFKKPMRDAGEAWEEVVAQEDIIELVELFVKQVSLQWVSPQFYTLMIYWKDNEWETETAVCFKGGCPSPHWSKEEERILREHYTTTSGKELMRLLPLRTLESMKVHAFYLGIRRDGKKKERNVRIFCLRDVEIMELYNLVPEDYHWKEGSRLVTQWQIVEERNSASLSG